MVSPFEAFLTFKYAEIALKVSGDVHTDCEEIMLSTPFQHQEDNATIRERFRICKLSIQAHVHSSEGHEMCHKAFQCTLYTHLGFIVLTKCTALSITHIKCGFFHAFLSPLSLVLMTNL